MRDHDMPCRVCGRTGLDLYFRTCQQCDERQAYEVVKLREQVRVLREALEALKPFALALEACERDYRTLLDEDLCELSFSLGELRAAASALAATEPAKEGET